MWTIPCSRARHSIVSVRQKGAKHRTNRRILWKKKLPYCIHAQKVVLTGKDWTEPEGTPDVQFGHMCVAFQVHHRVHGMIDGGVTEQEVCNR